MQNPFVGTWQLVSQDTVYPDGTMTPCRGENAAGILMYDAGGFMSVQLMRTDEHAADYTDLRELATAMDGYLAYFGRYEVDESAQVVRHLVSGASYPPYRGTTQVRAYQFDGDGLTLRAPSPDGESARVLVWRRAT